MLDTQFCKEYLDEVKVIAEKIGKLDSLQEQLEYLDTYACHDDPTKTKCVLGKDFAPLSFSFTMQRRNKDGEYEYWFNGGCIFHGQHDNGGDGGAPTFSVNLEPTDGWSIHT